MCAVYNRLRSIIIMFNANGKNSIIARTKTAPGANADNDSARFAVVSCASWEHGYFNSYENISARNDVDAVLHLGDYIYEYATGDFTGNMLPEEPMILPVRLSIQ
jgi:phosphodiesterase/alkaline phosphatase D-like protein